MAIVGTRSYLMGSKAGRLLPHSYHYHFMVELAVLTRYRYSVLFLVILVKVDEAIEKSALLWRVCLQRYHKEFKY